MRLVHPRRTGVFIPQGNSKAMVGTICCMFPLSTGEGMKAKEKLSHVLELQGRRYLELSISQNSTNLGDTRGNWIFDTTAPASYLLN